MMLYAACSGYPAAPAAAAAAAAARRLRRRLISQRRGGCGGGSSLSGAKMGIGKDYEIAMTRCGEVGIIM
uniref:Uncharacterized protein n=1 Tax=Arundo donax TaxID=35708 RepID=A0A0A9FWX4_ARUDO